MRERDWICAALLHCCVSLLLSYLSSVIRENAYPGMNLRLLWLRSSLTRFVKLRRANFWILFMLQWASATSWRLTRWFLTNRSFGKIVSWLPEKSSTWVPDSIITGSSVNCVFLHTIVSLPLRHMQEQFSGHRANTEGRQGRRRKRRSTSEKRWMKIWHPLHFLPTQHYYSNNESFLGKVILMACWIFST